jgi:hypothetical protein
LNFSFFQNEAIPGNRGGHKILFLVKIPIYLEVRDMKNLSGKQCLDLINDSIKEYNDESNDATYSIKTSPKDAEVIVLGVDKCLTDYKKPYVKGLEKRLNLLEAIKKTSFHSTRPRLI